MFLSKISDLIRSNKISCSAVIVAAGSSTRFGKDKLMTQLDGKPLIAHSLISFQACEYVNEIIVVVSEDKLLDIAALCEELELTKVGKIILGGATRLESSLAGVSECNPDIPLIAIHDGARPLVSAEVINNAIECAFAHKAAVPVVPSRDTVKLTDNKRVLQTPDRKKAFCAQTPQVFDAVIIKGALTNALVKNIDVFDDASAVEILEIPVYLAEGSEENIKITTPLDLKLAKLILESRSQQIICDAEAEQ